MKTIKELLIFLLCISTHGLHSFKLSYDLSEFHLSKQERRVLVYGYCRQNSNIIPVDLKFVIQDFVYGNPLQWKNKQLPEDLSGKDLRYFDFTGCDFIYTDLTDTNLEGVILTNTTCNYLKSFEDNIRKNKLTGGECYKVNFGKNLQRISQVYPHLKKNIHKAKLLHIACGFSRLPFYKRTELFIKASYWSCILLHLREELGDYAQKLIFSLEGDLKKDAKYYCWKSSYPHNLTNINYIAPDDASFEIYLNEFNKGVKNYVSESKSIWSFSWYLEDIRRSIQSLGKAYVKMEDQELQREACVIAYALSSSYKIGGMQFLAHYLFWQNRLIRLERLTRLGLEVRIYYSYRTMLYHLPISWYGGYNESINSV